tara:strand:+ start:1543 stop:3006 length:1464 start_codon:yes stop_codon:yes gene_type:complete
MVKPILALRFRDTTPDIDTITEHRSVVGIYGTVAWGWWKKAFEEVDTDAISSRIAAIGEIDVILIDPSTERAFVSSCGSFLKPNAAPINLIPAYYRDHVQDIAGVFILGAIAETEYDDQLASEMGEQTLLWVGEVSDPAFQHAATVADAAGKTCVLQLSDIHFGDDYGFRRQDEDTDIGDGRLSLTECLVADLERLNVKDKIAAIVVTGDFVTKGRWDHAIRQNALKEFEILRSCLDLKPEQIIAVAGNHDVVRYPNPDEVNVTENVVEKQTDYDHEIPFRHFLNQLVGRDVKESLNYTRRVRLDEVDLDVCVLNSCTITATKWTEYGYVGRNGLYAIAEMEKQPIEKPTFRFLALHHHLLPVADVEVLNSKGVTLAIDASKILSAAQSAGINVAIHGHQHKPKIALYQNIGLNGCETCSPIHVVASGSSGARNDRLPPGERNNYCLFQLKPDHIELWIRELRLDGDQGAEVYAGILATVPIKPGTH